MPSAGAAREVLNWLKPYEQKQWLKIAEEQYAFGDRLYSDRRWLTPSQEVHPPGTTFLGIVLDKTLEVSVVEAIDGDRTYHRPMTILPKGALFGTFEIADLMCQTEPLQNYTVFSGLRTFFFSDPKLDPYVTGLGREDFKRALGELVAVEKNDEEVDDGWWKWDRKSKKEVFWPTETSLELAKVFLRPMLRDWNSRILLIAIGSEFLAKVDAELQKIVSLVLRTAWGQSTHLRQQAIASYSTDNIMEILGGRAKGSRKISATFRAAIARELKTLPLLLTENRPGFRKVPISPGADEFGPFDVFFKNFKAAPKKYVDKYSTTNGYNKEFSEIASTEETIYAPQFLHDSNTELLFPLWPNYDPAGSGVGKSNDDFKEVLTQIKPNWPLITAELLEGDLGYYEQAVTLGLPEGTLDKIKNQVPSLLRGPVFLQSRPPQLPLFSEIDRLPGNVSAAGLIAVQHLMEETLCLVEEIVRRKLVEASDIWVLGKPYSSNSRIAYRLSQLGVTVRIPNEGIWRPGGKFDVTQDGRLWKPGKFDEWFDKQAADFLTEALASLRDKENRPVLLLDDGGTLIKAAVNQAGAKRFRAVEQTSRGIASACAAEGKFPVILVACSAAKRIVEPEFVVRAAIRKIAQYYPEALHLKKIGIIGLGSLGQYLAEYIRNRPDIHGNEPLGLKLSLFDRNGRPEAPIPTDGWCDSAKELFEKVDVVYGCSGNDYGADAKKFRRPGQLLISLSSGDIEFATLLQSLSRAEKEDYESKRWLLAPIRVADKIVAHGGFPITFDRSTASAPLIEMQLTRALLLLGIQQAITSREATATPLDPEKQDRIWKGWHARAIKGLDRLAVNWQKQRAVEFIGSEDLLNRAQAIRKEDVSDKNLRYFEEAIARFSQRNQRPR